MTDGSDDTADAAGDAPGVVEPTSETRDVPARREPIDSLVALFSAERGQELPRRFLSHLVEEERTGFDREDVRAALLIIDDADPDLRRLRFLVRVASEKHQAKFRQPALDLAREAIGGDLRESLFADTARSVAERFASAADHLRLCFRDETKVRRALNVLMLALEVLAVGARLTLEEATPVLRAALEEGTDSAAGPTNPNLARMAHLADPNLTAERLRGVLRMIEPWEQGAREAEQTRDRAAAREARAQDALAEANARVAELERLVESTRAQLADEREEQEALSRQLRDAGSLGESDVAAVRARALSFLEGRLRPVLETAREAGDVEPPRMKVTRRMIADALNDIDEEIAWLTSSA